MAKVNFYFDVPVRGIFYEHLRANASSDCRFSVRTENGVSTVWMHYEDSMKTLMSGNAVRKMDDPEWGNMTVMVAQCSEDTMKKLGVPTEGYIMTIKDCVVKECK